MSGVVLHAGIIEFGEFEPAAGSEPAHPGYVPAPTAGQAGYIFTADGWASPASLGVSPTFETVSKNLRSVACTLAYTSGKLTSLTYSNGVVKTLNYTGDVLTSIVLSGATPAGISLTKSLSYTAGVLTGVSYA